MKIISFNVLFSNKNHNKIIEFIKTESPDICSLQEVTVEFLNKLKKLDYYIFYDLDTFTFVENKKIKLYLVILSKTKINKKKEYIISEKFKYKTRSLFVIFLLKQFGWSKSNFGNGAIYIETEIKNEKYRIHNARLKLVSGINRRINQFNKIIDNLSEKNFNIITGDFNIIENKFVKPFSFFIEHSFKEAFLINERKKFEEIFKKYKLINNFKNNSTIVKIKNQTDHILTPIPIKIKNKKVNSNSLGSDHYPIILETN